MTAEKRQVWKFHIGGYANGEGTAITMPENAHIVHCGEQDSRMFIWAEVTPSNPLQERRFYVAWTGRGLPEDACHIGTIVGHPLVWHIYELPPGESD